MPLPLPKINPKTNIPKQQTWRTTNDCYPEPQWFTTKSAQQDPSCFLPWPSFSVFPVGHVLQGIIQCPFVSDPTTPPPFLINLGREIKQYRMSKPRRADLVNGKLSSPSGSGSRPWLPTRKILGAFKKCCLMPFQTSQSVARNWHPDMSSSKRPGRSVFLTLLDRHCRMGYSPVAMQGLHIAVTSPAGEHRLWT